MPDKFSATIGNFDGIHRGHMKLISHVLSYAEKNNTKSKAITFNPYPFEYFKRDKKRILANTDKIQLLNDLSIDSIDSIKFDEVFRSLTAEEFFQKYILDAGVVYLIVGKDFKFGIDRTGDISTLKDLCEQNSIVLEVAEDVLHGEDKISSTLIRSHLEKGEFSEVSKLLERPYQITGKVISGENIGKRISTPTANIDIDNVDFCFNGDFYVKRNVIKRITF
jgi:FAD synthase